MMNPKEGSIEARRLASRIARVLRLAVLATLVLVLGACSPDTMSVGIEPTATPVSTGYVNEAYGFRFDYPASWSLAEAPHLVTLEQGGLELRIGYRWAGERVDIGDGRTGMPAGDRVYEGKVLWMDQVVPATVLEHERKAKMVLYGEDGRVEDGDLQLVIWLEAAGDAPYETIDIPATVQAEAKAILESFERVAASSAPPTPAPTAPPLDAEASASYSSEAYGIAFDYPADWSLTEVPSTKVAEPGPFEPGDGTWSAERVELTRGALRIHVQLQSAARPEGGATRNLVWTAGHGGFYGDAVRNETELLGAEATRVTWVYDGGTKAVDIELGPPASDLVVKIELFDGTQPESLEAAEALPASAIETLDRIARSFRRTG